MAGQDLNRLNGRLPPYARARKAGWKICIGGLWHYGLLSEEQAQRVAESFFR